MSITSQHVRRAVLLTAILGAAILTAAGSADVLIQGAGMGAVREVNQIYLDKAFDSSLKGFLVLTGLVRYAAGVVRRSSDMFP